MNTLALRVVLLAGLLFGLNAWAVRHIGSDLQEIAVVNGFLGFVALVLGWIEERDAKDLRARVGQILRRAVDAPVLLALYLVVVLGTSLISSVTVMSDGHSGSTTLYLSPEGAPRDVSSQETLDGPSGVVRYIRVTSMFGRPFYLEADGFLRKSVQIFPWIGETISLSADLQRLPSILLRIPPNLHASLPGGKLLLDLGLAGTYTIETEAQRAAVQLGPPAAIPETWRREWRSELRTMSNVPDELRESFFRNWLNPIRDEAVPAMAPSQRLQVSFLTRANKEVIRQEVVVGWAPLQDVVLQSKGPGQ